MSNELKEDTMTPTLVFGEVPEKEEIIEVKKEEPAFDDSMLSVAEKKMVEDFSKQIAWKNWNYYEPRTDHGSSLRACMYGILACSCGYPNAAYPFFRKSAEADLKGGGKEWAGMV